MGHVTKRSRAIWRDSWTRRHPTLSTSYLCTAQAAKMPKHRSARSRYKTQICPFTKMAHTHMHVDECSARARCAETQNTIIRRRTVLPPPGASPKTLRLTHYPRLPQLHLEMSQMGVRTVRGDTQMRHVWLCTQVAHAHVHFPICFSLQTVRVSLDQSGGA